MKVVVWWQCLWHSQDRERERDTHHIMPQKTSLTFMHIIAKISRLFWPSDSMPILAVCRRPLTPYLQAQQQRRRQQL